MQNSDPHMPNFVLFSEFRVIKELGRKKKKENSVTDFFRLVLDI
jgi:hypothetical protein